MECRLDGQVAIVTGASSGLGKATALLLGKAGASVVVNYHANRESAEGVVEHIRAEGGQAIAIGADVGDEASVAALFSQTAQHFGAIDILVANSGIQQDASLSEMTLQQWQDVIDTNLTGQFLCMKEAVRQFRTQGQRAVSRAKGKILCMSSVHDVIPWAGHVNYAASKGGVAMLMKSVAQEVAADGIRVNAIAPGAIRTAINARNTEGEAGKRLLQLIPYGRIGATEDVARAALFLVSDMADYIVGTTLYVDGGMTLYPGFIGNG